jgi:polysaccharide biosynthesis protein PslH
MRILWVKANKILPVHSGGDIRSFNLLRQLAVKDEVIFFSYYDGAADAEYARNLQRELPGAVAICTGRHNSAGVARGMDYVLRLPSSLPYAVSRFESKAVKERLAECIRTSSPDVVVCDFLDAAVNFPESMDVPVVLFQHNVESEIWRRHAETNRSLGRKQMYQLEFARMLRYEQQIVKKFDHVIAVSEHDRSLMSAWTDPSRISVVPTGVDVSRFKAANHTQTSQPLVLFIGAMDWEPNVDGVGYFCREVWPRVLSQMPAARFRIVGRNPDRRTHALASASVEVTGSVPSVIEHLQQAAVVVVPLRIGGGTRLKIYEAMAAGKAVVSTTIGAEGLDVKHGTDIWLADDSEEFAGAIVRLMRDENTRHSLEVAAAETAARHDWPAVGAAFKKILLSVVSPRERQQLGEMATAG